MNRASALRLRGNVALGMLGKRGVKEKLVCIMLREKYKYFDLCQVTFALQLCKIFSSFLYKFKYYCFVNTIFRVSYLKGDKWYLNYRLVVLPLRLSCLSSLVSRNPKHFFLINMKIN